MAEFESRVSEFIDIENRLKTITDEAKELRRMQKDLSNHIIKFMKEADKTKCETADMNLLLSHNSTQLSLSVPMLKIVFQEYFPGRNDICEGLMAAIVEYRKKHANSGIRIKKIRRRSKD